MNVKQVSYARTINLGNYENERIELVADIDIDECYDSVLLALREMVARSSHSIAPHSPQVSAPTNPPALNMINSEGKIISSCDSAREWLLMFDKGISMAADLRNFVSNNKDVFDYIKRTASNDAQIDYLYRLEQRIAKAFNYAQG